MRYRHYEGKDVPATKDDVNMLDLARRMIWQTGEQPYRSRQKNTKLTRSKP